MIQKWKQRISSIVLLVTLVLSMNITTFAADFSEIDMGQMGSVTVTVVDKETQNAVPGVAFSLYHVGSIRFLEESLKYVYNEMFEGNGMSLDDLRAEGLADHLANYALEHEEIIGDMKKTGADGKVCWENLNMGLYLVVQVERVQGRWAAEPFLVSVPFCEEGEDEWTYDVDASPKMEILPEADTEVMVRKVWVDNGSHRPDDLIVNLYRDNEKYDSVVLNEENHWSYTWTNLNGYYIWTVKEEKVPDGYQVSYGTSEREIIITNTAEKEKPPVPPMIQTGQLNWPIPVLAGVGILLFAIGWILTFLKRKE